MSENILQQVEQQNNEITTLIQQGKYDEGISTAKNTLELARKHLGEEHPELGRSLKFLGMLYMRTGKFTEAEQLLDKSVEIIRKACGETHHEFGECLKELGVVYREIGKFNEAERLLMQAVEILKREKGEENPGYILSLNALGILHEQLGDFGEAERYYKKVTSIVSVVFGEDHPYFAGSLNNLANNYRRIGNGSLAGQLYLKAIEIRRNTIGEEHPDFAASLDNLGVHYQQMGDSAAAETLHRQANEIWRKTVGEDSQSFALSVELLAQALDKLNCNEEAEKLYKQAQGIFARVLGIHHSDYAMSLHNLGIFYAKLGRNTDAEMLYKQAHEIWSKTISEDHPHISDSFCNMGKISAATGREKEALDLLDKSMDLHNRMIGKIFAMSSENQRMEYLASIKEYFDTYLSLILEHYSDSRDAVQNTLDLVLRRKAIGAEALAAQRDAVLCGKYPDLKDKLKELTMLRMQIATKVFKGPGPEGKEAFDQLLNEWNEGRESLESELVRQIPEMDLEEKLQSADRHAVAQALPDDSVLVEFVRFNVYDFKAVPAKGQEWWKPARYIAFVLPAGDPENIEMIDLGEAEKIDELIAEFRASTLGEGDGSVRSVDMVSSKPDCRPADGIELRKIVFDKLSDAMKGYNRILLAPDGDLSRLPFEVLPSDDGRHLLDDYQISYLSVGRDALRFGAENLTKPATALVAADPDFNISSDETAESKGEEAIAGSGWRQSRDLDRSEFRFNPLPGTRPEGERVSDLLGVEPWFEEDVLEAKVKSIHSPFILHLATHGFFLEDQKVDLEKETRPRYENPLLRSGLALAGANTFVKGGTLPEEAEDGILTAEDVTGLDLLGTELVVLSACDTGLGDVRVGEGVFGLRRSFMLAGAKTLVMSLWKVPDLATPILMERFYDNLLNKGLGRADSLREAQVYTRDVTMGEIREMWLTDEMVEKLALGNKETKAQLKNLAGQPDDFTPFSDPIYWGAFICQGDPGAIQTS